MTALQSALRWLLTAGCLLGGLAGSVSRVALSPTTLQLPSAQRSVSVTVTNDGDAPVTFQVSVLQWTQDGQETLAVTDQLLAAPAQFTLAPGAQQVVRVARLAGTPVTQRAFRLQLLQAPGAGGGVQMSVRHLLPLFDGPAGTPRLGVEAEPGAVTLRNTGTGTLRLVNLEVQVGAQWVPVGLRYVLPGGRLTLDTGGAVAATALRYQDAAGVTVTAPVDPP